LRRRNAGPVFLEFGTDDFNGTYELPVFSQAI
jgi:hypothetical protein